MIFFKNGECVFQMIDCLDDEDPLLRHLSKSWLNQAYQQFQKIMDPIFKFLLDDKICLIKNKDNILIEKEYNSSQIRANVLYVGLCHSDIFHVRDLWHNVMPTTYPLVPGHEFVWEVAEVGSNVKNFKKGEKVGFGTKRTCCGNSAVSLSGDDELCSDVKDDLTYGRYFGGYATQVQ